MPASLAADASVPPPPAPLAARVGRKKGAGKIQAASAGGAHGGVPAACALTSPWRGRRQLRWCDSGKGHGLFVSCSETPWSHPALRGRRQLRWCDSGRGHDLFVSCSETPWSHPALRGSADPVAGGSACSPTPLRVCVGHCAALPPPSAVAHALFAKQVASDVSSFIGSALRASPYMKRNFVSRESYALWVDAKLGVPRRFAGDLGIAARGWLVGRGLLEPLASIESDGAGNPAAESSAGCADVKLAGGLAQSPLGTRPGAAVGVPPSAPAGDPFGVK